MCLNRAEKHTVPARLPSAELPSRLASLSSNWLQTILPGDYVGFMYILYLAIAAAFMSDIVCNRARLTTQLINAILILIGSAASAVIC